MSRLWIIEYDGEDPELNYHKLSTMPEAYLEHLRAMIASATSSMVKPPVPVQHTADAAEQLLDFSDLCRAHKRMARGDESQRQQWTRAYEKVFRLGALLAVADNFIFPTMTKEHVVWAQDLLHTNGNLSLRLSCGDLGDDDRSRETAVLNKIARWLDKVHTDAKFKEMRDNAIVTRRYLQQETANLESFRGHRNGASQALNETLRGLIDNGYIMNVDGGKVAEMYNFLGKCYRIVHMPVTCRLSSDHGLLGSGSFKAWL